MATKYDYNNTYFCKRIKLRAEITDRNRIINGIAHSVGTTSDFHTMIMNRFYGKETEQNIKSYENKVSPISYFNVKALETFKFYLDGIIDMVILEQKTGKQLTVTSLRDIIILQGKIIREMARQMDSLPEHNDKESRLPKNITGTMIKKALKTLTKSEVQIFGGEMSVVTNDPDAEDNIIYETKKTQKPNKAYESIINAINAKRKDAEMSKKEKYSYDKNLFGEKVVYVDAKALKQQERAIIKENHKLSKELSDLKYELKASQGTSVFGNIKAEFDSIQAKINKNYLELQSISNKLNLSLQTKEFEK